MPALLSYANDQTLKDGQSLPTDGYAVSGDAAGKTKYEVVRYSAHQFIADIAGVVLRPPSKSPSGGRDLPGYYAKLSPAAGGVIHAEKLGFFPGPVTSDARDALARAARDRDVYEVRLSAGIHVLPSDITATGSRTRHTPLAFENVVGADITGQGDSTVITWAGGPGFFSQVAPGGSLLRIARCKQFAIRKLKIDGAASSDTTFDPVALQLQKNDYSENLSAVSIRGSDDVHLSDCHLTNAWGTGVSIGWGCGDVEVAGCDFTAIARRAISITWVKRAWIVGCKIGNCRTGLKVEPNFRQAVGTVVFKHNQVRDWPGRPIDALSGSVHGGSYVAELEVSDCFFLINEPGSFHAYLLGMGTVKLVRNAFVGFGTDPGPWVSTDVPLITVGDQWWSVVAVEMVDNIVFAYLGANFARVHARGMRIEGNTVLGTTGTTASKTYVP